MNERPNVEPSNRIRNDARNPSRYGIFCDVHFPRLQAKQSADDEGLSIHAQVLGTIQLTDWLIELAIEFSSRVSMFSVIMYVGEPRLTDNGAGVVCHISLAAQLQQESYQGSLAFVLFDKEEPCNRGINSGGSSEIGKELAVRKH
jgi:hypothetical protein